MRKIRRFNWQGAFLRSYRCVNTELGEAQNELADYALFVVAPEPEDFHYLLVLEHLVDQTMLNIDAA